MSDPTSPPPPKSKALDPRVISLSVSSGDSLSYSETINVDYDKPDTSSDATLTLRCWTSSGHDDSDPHNIDAMLPNGTEPFNLNHSADLTGVTIRATITQPGYPPHFLEATGVKICAMPPCA